MPSQPLALAKWKGGDPGDIGEGQEPSAPEPALVPPPNTLLPGDCHVWLRMFSCTVLGVSKSHTAACRS